MVNRTLQRFSKAANLLNPATLIRTLARVDQLTDASRQLEKTVEALRVHTEQLMAIERMNWEQREELRQVAEQLDATRIAAQVDRAVDAAAVEMEPFPHAVIEQWLPRDVYHTLIRAIPPPVFFADREPSRQRLMVPFEVAPAYSQRVWRFLSEEIISGALQDALNRKFRGIVEDYVRTFCPALPAADLTLHASDGRIMLRRPGYVITPHRDPKWGFLTGLVYLARRGDNEGYGTQLYRVKDDEEAPTDKPFYVEPERCELTKSVPFRANTMLVFMNSAGAHGASIPADAQPADLERYVYQYRLGPARDTVKKLLSHMPPERRTSWAGAKSERADAY